MTAICAVGKNCAFQYKAAPCSEKLGGKRPMGGFGRLAAALILGMAVSGAPAKAQDTSFMDMNMDMGCMLMAGMHEFQVSVYQSGARDDSCSDLPSPGTALITLSSPAKEMRDLTTEVRLIKGEEGNATAGSASLDAVTLAYLPPKTYPTGIASLTANFEEPGKYTLLVTMSDGKDMTMSGRHVMTVGAASRQWLYAFLVSGAIVVAAFGYYLWDQRRKKAAAGTA